MDKVLRWLSKGVYSLYQAGRPVDDDAYSSYERIDGATLGASGFGMSASMRFRDGPQVDFSETLPAYTPKLRAKSAPASRRFA
jgi:hypothetical protein